MMSDVRLQSTLNTQGGNFVGNFVYNHKNQKKVLVRQIVKDELSFSLCKSFNFEEYVQLVLQSTYKKTNRCIFKKVTMTNFLAMK